MSPIGIPDSVSPLVESAVARELRSGLPAGKSPTMDRIDKASANARAACRSFGMDEAAASWMVDDIGCQRALENCGLDSE